MASQGEFDKLLGDLRDNDNQVRSAGEKTYDAIPLDQKGSLLFATYLNAAVNQHTRAQALVLLRRILTTNYAELWTAMGQEMREQFHTQIFKYVVAEQDETLQNRLIDVLGELARNTINDDTGKQEWPGVLQFLKEVATSNPKIGMALIENVPNVFGTDQAIYLNDIKQMFYSCLLYANDNNVKTAAGRALVAFVCDNEEDDGIVRSFAELVPALIQVCKTVVDNEEDDDVLLQCLCDLASGAPKMLTPHMNDVFTLCLATVGDTEKEDSYRHSALEVMVSLCESVPKSMRKRGAAYVAPLIQLCLQLMTELDDDITEWLALDDAEDEIEEENAGYGETSLDRVSCALGAKAVLQPAMQNINVLLKRGDDWKCRHAGIMALSTIGEGCKRQMEPMITEVLNQLVIPHLGDAHPRVRYAACNAIGQMCTDFAPTPQKKCHEKIVPGLLAALRDLETPRVAAHAGAAIVNFCEECPKTYVEIYLKSIMQTVEAVLEQTFRHMLENGKKLVLEQILTSIASVADAAKDSFAHYYGKMMPPLKYILENSNTDQLKMLRGKTIECISLIGLAVGKEIFQKDVDGIMRLLLASDVNFENVEDPQISYMISAWARICKVLGGDFAPYLETVMPAVITAADFKPDVAIVDDDEAENIDEAEWNFIPTGDQRSLAIKTSGLEDKVNACEMLVCFAREMKGSFLPWTEKVLNLMLPLTKFLFHDAVRSAAAEIMPCLLECAKGAGPATLKHMWDLILPAYREAISKESDLDVLSDIITALAACVDQLGKEIISAADLTVLFEVIGKELTDYEQRREERLKASKEEDGAGEEDQEDQDDELEREASVLAALSDLVHALFGAFKESLLPYFNPLVPQFAALLDPSRHYHSVQWGLCIWDDVIEFLPGDASVQYQQVFFEPILTSLNHKFPEVRQAAAYGCGLMGLCGGTAYTAACAQLIQPLAMVIQRPGARETEEDCTATENAISAMAKILKHNSASIDTSAAIPVFLNVLPTTWTDCEEAPYALDYFCDLVESNHPLVLGENNANLPHIFGTILSALSHGLFVDGPQPGDGCNAELVNSVKARLVAMVKVLHSNPAVFQAIVSNLSMDALQKQALQKALGQ